MDEKIKKEIEEYAKLPASKQLAEFSRYDEKIKHSGIDIEASLLLLMKTKVGIFANNNYTKITKHFKKIHRIINEVEQNYLENFIKSIGEYQKEELNKFLSEITEAVAKFNEYKVTILSKTDDQAPIVAQKIKSLLSNRIDAVEKIYKDYNFKISIEKRKNAFNNTANKYRCRSVLALGVAVIFFLSLLAFGILLTCSEFFYNSYDNRMNYLAMVSFIGGKILVATTLFFALVSSVRVYFAFSHNETICRHRRDVLDSYKAIYDIVEDDDKRIIISKVTDAMFTQLPTGFSKLQSDEGKSNVSLESLVDLINKAK